MLSALLLGCQNEPANIESSISAYRDRMLVQHQETPPESEPAAPPRQPVARPIPEQSELPPRSSLMTQPATESQPAPEAILAELADPTEAPQVFERRLERLRRDQAQRQDQHVVRNFERVVEQANEYLKLVGTRQDDPASRRPQVHLSLAECAQRALANNYTIRIEAHNPAISETQIVEAEAAFDAEFFLDTSWANLDQATASTFVPGTSDQRTIAGGFRKLLPTGMVASISTGLSRSKNSLPQQYQTLNPAFSTNLVGELRQPLLRGFGLDVNRAQINIRKIEHQISVEVFAQRVRDTLLTVEQAYWQLAQARRRATIYAESTAQNLITYRNMQDRLGHDATQVEVSNSEARWKTSYVAYLEYVKLIRDAEDQLKNVLNDPTFKLSEDVEIIPTETPLVAPIVLDHFVEVRTALDRRSEIRQAKERIHATRINTLVAKNAILPNLEASFRYEVQGMGRTADNSFDNLTTNRFISYTLGASFSYSFGERAARAAHRRARLQESQAIVSLNQATDLVVTEVNNSIRTLMVRYTQLPPSLESVQAAERNLRALQARTQRIDPNYLQTELGAVEQLASTRNTLLSVLLGYNVGIVELEKAKGTLLDYNNVVVSDAQPKR